MRNEGIQIWRDGILDKRFRVIDAEIGIGGGGGGSMMQE
jgi:hypothetical protein